MKKSLCILLVLILLVSFTVSVDADGTWRMGESFTPIGTPKLDYSVSQWLSDSTHRKGFAAILICDLLYSKIYGVNDIDFSGSMLISNKPDSNSLQISLFLKEGVSLTLGYLPSKNKAVCMYYNDSYTKNSWLSAVRNKLDSEGNTVFIESSEEIHQLVQRMIDLTDL